MTGQTVSREELPGLLEHEFAAGRAFVLTVTGDSMGPTLRHLRDRVVLVPPQRKTPGRGDIVLFRRENGAFVLHRILRVRDDGSFVINGDAQVWTETADIHQIYAVAEGIERKGRYISCDSGMYRAYVRAWQVFRTARPYMIAFQRAVKKIFGR